jgi:thiol-disulfide isomerase/thioredoxin
VAAMTIITIFLPTGQATNQPSSTSAHSKKSLVSRHVMTEETRCGNRDMKLLVFLVLCCATVALADDFKLVIGKEYKNATVSRIEPDGIVLRTKSGTAKVYFIELPEEVRERFHYNVAIASGDSAQQAVSHTTMDAARREPVEVISHGAQVDIAQHLVPGSVTVVDFYADWCVLCRQLGPSLEQMARSDPGIALRKIDIVNWKTAVVQQFNIQSIPHVNVYDRDGRLVGTVVGPDFDKVKSYVAQAKRSG